MQFIDIQENQNSFNGKQISGDSIEKKSMHPDDFAAHLAWVTAKRSHENILDKTFTKNIPKYYWIFG
jgi:hypothetical protein